MKLFNRKNWKAKGMEIINSHFGKKRVYESYLKLNPVLAEKYLRFVSRHRDVVYITWDNEMQGFRA